MENTQLKINNSFIVNALRNCGYDTYSAIADIIDNSIEKDIRGTFVSVDISSSNKIIENVKIIDDGEGMTMETLHEAMSLGSETGKTAENNLGMYGSGMKTASFALGQTLDVYTKTRYGNVEHARISIKDVINHTSDKINVLFETIEDKNDISRFNELITSKNKNAISGTVVIISDLDKLTNKNDVQKFIGSMSAFISETFSKFISLDVLKFYVSGSEIKETDIFGVSPRILENGVISVGDNTIKYKVVELHDVEDSNHEQNESKDKNKYFLTKNLKNQGIYIYRQERLVGRALTLGIFTKHPESNAFRCELNIDGRCDSLFGSSFTKIISERTANAIDQSLFDKLSSKLNPLIQQIRRDRKIESELNNMDDMETKRKKEEFYNKVAKDLNQNQLLRVKRTFGENKKRDNPQIHNKVQNPQKHPALTRARCDKWLANIEERSLGQSFGRFFCEKENNRTTVVINTDHRFFKEIYNKLDDDLKYKMALTVVCDEIAKRNINYDGSDEVRQIIDSYVEVLDSEMSKVLKD